MGPMERFEAAQCHAKKARELRRVAKGCKPGMRRLLQARARTHEAMVRVHASVAAIEACDARFLELQGGGGAEGGAV